MNTEEKIKKRPNKQKIIDWTQIDECLIAGCIGTEIAEAIGVHPDTLYRRCKEDNRVDFAAYSQQKRSIGHSLLRKAQFDAALNGNTSMLIWLGKQRLGQHEPEPKASDTCKPALIEYLERLKNAS